MEILTTSLGLAFLAACWVARENHKKYKSVKRQIEVEDGLSPEFYRGLSDNWNFIQSPDGQWRWRRTSRNNRVVDSSTEAYRNFTDCKNNAERTGYIKGAEITYFSETFERKKEVR